MLCNQICLLFDAIHTIHTKEDFCMFSFSFLHQPLRRQMSLWSELETCGLSELQNLKRAILCLAYLDI